MLFYVLDEPRRVLLNKIVSADPVPSSYLAGGTALAIIYGHRESIDFDWFTPSDFDPGELVKRLSEIGKVDIAETRSGTFHGWIDGIQVTWLRYPNPLLDTFLVVEQIEGLRIASVTDIAIMKWAAISDRGSRKDFIDLFTICRQGLTVESLVPLLPRKLPHANLNYYYMIKSLAYFDDAEKEGFPVMLERLDWHEVKAYFIELQKKLLKHFLPG